SWRSIGRGAKLARSSRSSFAGSVPPPSNRWPRSSNKSGRERRKTIGGALVARREPMNIPIHGRPPSRADHIGSLLRPARLCHAFREFHDGRLGAAEFRAIQDEAIRDIVK